MAKKMLDNYNYKIGQLVHHTVDDKSICIVVGLCDDHETLDLYFVISKEKIFERKQYNCVIKYINAL
jgi:hypothetical protein